MDEVIIDNKKIVKEFKVWKENEEKAYINNEQIAGNTTAPISTVYGKVQVQNYQLGKDLQSNLGRPDTRHGEAAEKLEVRARNRQHLLRGEETSARSETNRIDPKADIYDNGNTYQVKFCKTPEATLQSMLEKDYRGVKKIVPKEQYEEIMELAGQRRDRYNQKASECKKNGDLEGYNKYREKADKCDDILKTSEPSMTSRDAAIKAAKHPTAAAMGYVVSDAVEAGVKAGATAAVVSGVISGITNVVEVWEGNKTFDEAAGDTAKAVGKSALAGAAYGTVTPLIQGTSGVVAKNIVEDGAAKQVLNGIAKSDSVTYVLVATVEYTKTLKMYFDGKIDKKEMLIRVGDTTVGMSGSIVGGVIGSAAGPIGTIVGSTLGYLATTAFYHSVIEVIQLKSLATEYERIIPLLKEAQEEMLKAREEFETICYEYRMARFEKVSAAMDILDKSIDSDDVESFLTGLNTIVSYYGESLLYTDFNVFDRDMREDSFVLKI